MLCDDPLVRLFRRYGYNVVRLPSTTFRPLLVLESDGRRKVRVIGPLERELPGRPGTPSPTVYRDAPVADIELVSSGRLAGDVAASFLTPILALAGVDASVGTSLSREAGVEVSLTEISRDAIEPGELGRYLESGVRATSERVRQFAERGELFVTTATLKSGALRLKTSSQWAHELNAKGPASVGVNVDVKTAAGAVDTSTVAFEGTSKLAFAFQAVQLAYENGEYVDFESRTGILGYELPGRESGPGTGRLHLLDDLADVDDIDAI